MTTTLLISPAPVFGTISGDLALTVESTLSGIVSTRFFDLAGRERELAVDADGRWQTGTEGNRPVRLIARVYNAAGKRLATSTPRDLRIAHTNSMTCITTDLSRPLSGTVELVSVARRGDGRVQVTDWRQAHPIWHEFRLDGEQLGWGYAPTLRQHGGLSVYRLPFDTTKYPDGLHELTAMARTVEPEDAWNGRCVSIDPREVRITNG